MSYLAQCTRSYEASGIMTISELAHKIAEQA
jgi:hypothetical protein